MRSNEHLQPKLHHNLLKSNEEVATSWEIGRPKPFIVDLGTLFQGHRSGSS